MIRKLGFVILTFVSLAGFAFTEDLVINIRAVSPEGVGKQIGTITASDSKWGLLLTPNLADLPPGIHGFHVHENPSCDPAEKEGKMTAAQSAGGHFDPDKSGRHNGPYQGGHHGDLPALYVNSDGKATLPVLAPRMRVSELKGHSLMVHAGGDNYSDQPGPLGGGGARI